MPDQDYIPEIIALVFERDALAKLGPDITPYIKMQKTLAGDYIIVYVDIRDVETIIQNPANFAMNVFPHVMALLGEADLAASGITQIHRQPFLNLRGSGVLLGFVDTGIDYTLEAFRYEDGSSKIRYIWDQTVSGNPPEGFHYGTQYDNDTINMALNSPNPLDIVPSVDTVGHGTFLASVAGSRESGEYVGAAPDSEIIAVKLKRALRFDYIHALVPLSKENAYSAADIMMGVQYIAEKARELGRPVAICLGLGTNTGSHDGGSALEGFLSRISSTVGTSMCVAAGNEAQAAHHTNDKISTGESVDIEIRVSNSEDIFVSMWSYAGDRMSVSVKSPTGEKVSRVPARAGSRYSQKLVLERATVIVEYAFPVGRYGGQYTTISILSATIGVWTVTAHADSVIDGTFHMWLPITGLNPGATFLTPKPNYTITLPATSTGVITCGAYSSYDNSLSPTSSWGPSRLPSILPDLVAPGRDVTGIYPGGVRGKMSGTSVSAAITAGASALLLQWAIVEGNDPSMDSNRIRANLLAGCERDPGVQYPNNQWGYGRLNLVNTFRSLRPT